MRLQFAFALRHSGLVDIDQKVGNERQSVVSLAGDGQAERSSESAARKARTV